MSWNSYIDNLKSPDQSGKAPIEDAVICGHAGDVWACSEAYKGIKAEDVKKLLPADKTSFYQNGVEICGQKCRMLREWDDNGVSVVDLKTKANEAGDTFSVCVAKTTQAVIICRGTKDASGGQVDNMVLRTAQHLKQAGY